MGDLTETPPTETTLTAAELAHLQTYLPLTLHEMLVAEADNPSSSVLKRCVVHLSALHDATTSHLPPYLVKQVSANPVPGLAGGQFVDGTLLFADISGFTAMSERLSRIGREGAEEVTAVVNQYFDVMLDILRRYDGQLIRFGGDALLGLFTERPFADLPNSATSAVQAAVQMQNEMTQFAETKTSIGTFPLRMSVGLHRGHFFAAQLGTADNMEFAVFGKDVNETAAIEAVAQAGQVVLDADTFARVDADWQCTAVPVPDNPHYLRVEALDVSQLTAVTPKFDTLPPLTSNLTVLRDLVHLLDALTPYLPAGLLARLTGDPRAPSLKGEHRLVATLFANIEGLGAIADRLGVGNETEIVTALNSYFVAMNDAMRVYGGVINKIDLYDHGDKLMVTFGAPTAHEDDAERAVRAALAMQESLQHVAQSIPFAAGVPDLVLEQRIGISYAFVFAGYLGASWRHEYTVMGDEVNLAARLMSTAESGQILVNQNVRRQAEAVADLPLLGEVSMKGKSEPVPVFQVTGLKAVRQQVRGVAGMESALVGRALERDLLETAVADLYSGFGKIVSIIGEAGIGKSRLVADLPQDGLLWRQSRCYSYTETVSYRVFQELLRDLLGLDMTEDEAAYVQLQTVLSSLFVSAAVDETLPYLAHFLNLPLTAVYQQRIQYLDGEALQQRTHIAIRDVLFALAAAQPVVLVFDNIHWMDHASLALLEFMLPLVSRMPMLFLLLFRPERNKGCWTLKEKIQTDFADAYEELVLGGLDAEFAEQLLRNLADVPEWPTGSIDLILNRAEGNPLYLEEVLRSLINDGLLVQDENGRWQFSDEVQDITVPDTLEGVLLARLDRLEELCRWTVQVASVVGRSFPLDVLTEATAESEDLPVGRYLSELETVEIIEVMQSNPEEIYAFMHSLMQEVSYSSLAASSRRKHHRLIAKYLEDGRSQGWGNVESLPPLIAHHAYLGGDWERALIYQLMAGQQAQQLFANEDALDHFEKALHAAKELGESQREQLQIHLALGQLYIATGQYDLAATHLDQAQLFAPDLGDGLAETAVCRWQARLFEQRGDYPQAMVWIDKGLANRDFAETAEYAQILLISGLINIRQGKYDEALAAVQPVLEIAEKLNAVTVLARAKSLIGIAYYSRSDNDTAIENFQTSYELYHRAGDVRGEATAHNLIANVYFNLGRWREADFHYDQALTMFDRIGDIYNRALTQNNLGGIAKNQGRFVEAIHFYEEALQSIEQIGGSVWIIGAFHMNLGATYVRQGNAELALQHLQQGHTYFTEAQSRDFLAELLRHMAEAYLLLENFEQAQMQIDEALALDRELNARGEEGCALRVQGKIAQVQGHLLRAQEMLESSVAILQEVADEYELACSRLALAQVLALQGEVSAAQELMDMATAVFGQLEASHDLVMAQHLQNRLGN